jgi:predicted transposase YbfD/YdcC
VEGTPAGWGNAQGQEVSMSETTLPPLLAHFVDLEDPRVERTKRHKLLDILGIALCATLSGADTIVAIEQFGRAKFEWLKTFLELPNGIPSHDTFGRVFAVLDPERFARCFGNWVARICPSLELKTISIDGKTSRGSGSKEDKPLHLVSAWANEARLTLGQVAVADKSNEITAIPALLEILELKGAIVTIDALGTQKNIAKKIVEKEADYVLPVKENHPHLFEDLEKMFTRFVDSDLTALDHDLFSKENKGHGRTETRTVTVFTDIQELRDWQSWKNLQCVIVVVRECWQEGKASLEVSYYISSKKASAEAFYGFIRDHWGIENKCHWVLDVCFGEDDSRVREGHSPENLSCLRRMAMAILRNSHDVKGGFATRRLIAGWNETYLETLLFGAPA